MPHNSQSSSLGNVSEALWQLAEFLEQDAEYLGYSPQGENDGYRYFVLQFRLPLHRESSTDA